MGCGISAQVSDDPALREAPVETMQAARIGIRTFPGNTGLTGGAADFEFKHGPFGIELTGQAHLWDLPLWWCAGSRGGGRFWRAFWAVWCAGRMSHMRVWYWRRAQARRATEGLRNGRGCS